MALLEAAALEVGAAIAKSILKFWVKDSTLGEDVSSGLIDLLKTKTSDLFAQRKGERQFADVGDKIGQSLLPLFEIEGARLDDNERTAVALAVAETFNRAKISSELLAERNLQPAQLAQYMLSVHSITNYRFGEPATELYRRIIQESCTYVVDIASQLPSFTEHTFAEVLKREDQIIAKATEILEELQRLRKQLDPMVEAEGFEIEYRQAVARNLDVVQLIGADVSLTNRRHRLSVAYITLSVEQQAAPLPTRAEASTQDSRHTIKQNIVSVDATLANSDRLLIRGPAGSGKTTLLQWIAVKAATKSFEGQLANWNGRVPFYIRLRRYVQSGLPGPESFPDFAAPAIARTMPEKWVHTILKSGRAIVLVDGVDEIPASQREDVYTWLKDLVETYPKAHFIITSRPYAIEEGWMDREGLNYAELQPMGLADIYSFIEHWHEAVRQELHTDEEKNEIVPLADQLKKQVRQVRAIRNLATSPLLCAMLCALNRQRRQQLPVNRIEMYRACCSLLLERREKESGINLSDYPALNLGQKQRFLEDLAYWMIQENLSEVAVSIVDERFREKLAHMPGLSQDTSGKGVRRLLVERTGMLREPVAGQIDFTHRTFQEFFAAQAALDAMDIKKLVANAHNDQWREVVILAEGLASKAMCEQLVNGLIKRGETEKEHRHQLHLIAISCLDSAIELGPEVRAEVVKRLSRLVPPKNITDAKAIAAAGELTVKYLAKKGKPPITTCAACVRALSIIGGDLALDMLEGYANDDREGVISELLRAWDAFDRETYARRILSQTLRNKTSLPLEHLPSLDGMQYFTNLTQLDLSGCAQVNDLTPLAGLTSLIKLDLSGCAQVSDLTPLAGLTSLTWLNLSGCAQVSDLTPLAGLTSLTWLNLGHCAQVRDLAPLAGLTSLTTLDLSGCAQVNDLTPLADLTSLTWLDLSGCAQVNDLTPLAGLTSSTWLDLSGCAQVNDLTPLAGLTGSTELNLSGCDQLTTLGLTGLTGLTALNLSGCDQLTTLGLTGLTSLTALNLSGCTQVRDLTPLAGLTSLTWLNLGGCAQVSDLTPLAGLTSLTELDLSRCAQVSDLAPLKTLTRLEYLLLSENMDRLTIPSSIKKKVYYNPLRNLLK